MAIWDNLTDLLKTKENHTLEFKKAANELPKSFWETYSAFANTEGGIIILGVEEGEKENVISGVNNPSAIVKDIWNQLHNRNKVSFNILENSDIMIQKTDENKQIIIVKVLQAPWSNKPVYINGVISKAYIRTGDGDRLMNDDELRLVMRNSSPQSDSLLLDSFSIQDLDPISIASFKERVSARYPDNEYANLNPEEFLLEIGALRLNRNTEKIRPTKGTLLFLGKYNSIREVYPSFHLDYLNRSGDNERWIDRVATDEPSKQQMNIYNFYNIVSEKLAILFYKEFKLDDKNIRIEYNRPDESIREALVNTLAHADYDLGLPSVKIEAFRGWLRFLNPGIMLIPIPDFIQGGTSKPRNETIMKLFRLLGLSERQGFGGPQMFKSATNNKFRLPEIFTGLESTELKLWHIDLLNSYPELKDEEKMVFEAVIKSAKFLSKREISEVTGLTIYKVGKSLDSLIKTGKLRVTGNGASTKYALRAETSEAFTQLEIIINELRRKQGT